MKKCLGTGHYRVTCTACGHVLECDCDAEVKRAYFRAHPRAMTVSATCRDCRPPASGQMVERRVCSRRKNLTEPNRAADARTPPPRRKSTTHVITPQSPPKEDRRVLGTRRMLLVMPGRTEDARKRRRRRWYKG